MRVRRGHACDRPASPERTDATAEKRYICIDLKSFYASVECADRGLDPFRDNLVVADPDRGRTTICLAVTPAMKALGVRNRCRVYEIPEGIDYVMARPRMKRYMQASADIYAIYLRHVSADDVHVYSVDECFIDATPYLPLYGVDARGFAKMLMEAVFDETGICATAGIGTNLFLTKVALDVMAKHAPDNIGELDEESFKREIWFHTPITDIWGIGPRIAKRLERHGARDLASVAALPEQLLYREFGANAEYLIDHAWGQEPCTIADIHAYVPEGHSMTNSQVLPSDYDFEEARMVLREMVDASTLELVGQRLVAGRISLSVTYSWSQEAHVPDGAQTRKAAPRAHAHTGGSRKLDGPTSSGRTLWERFSRLFDETSDRETPIRAISINLEDLEPEAAATPTLFDDVEAERKERAAQEAAIAVREKYGKNALLKGTSLQEKATARERNEQVGGHHA